ncbi:UDP-N-acetylmuramoyl-L-alanine--D-glutamate ligase [Candidatus Daviesbacteria bacterium]|nr:UDP-N-acetylmuramoyl-L-alanine--D-glutamate ligase [Candidatus Daviesbacteria bacterium]
MGDKFKGKKVLIFGLGLNQGGVGSAIFFAKEGAEVKVTDLKSEEILKPSLEQLKEFKNITYSLGEHKYEDLNWADIIIRNPGVKDSNPYLKYAFKKGKRVETDFSVFLEYADQKKLIAVTGTKGKSTTSSLIYEAIKASGQKVVFAGNIGKSILDTIPALSEKPWIVVEISSFQLQSLNTTPFSPNIAVITNIYPDHLNWHSSMEEYVQAKKRIALDQTTNDFLFIPCGEDFVSEQFLQGIKSQIKEFCFEDIKEKFSEIELPLKGVANLQNYAAAIAVTETLGIEDKIAVKAFEGFKGGEFRMQTTGEFNGIKIINDSTATNPVATVAALQALGGPNLILISGGMNKGMDYTEMAMSADKSTRRVFLLTGDSSEEIKKLIRNKSIIAGTYDDLESLLGDVKKEAKSGDTILFSPGATSFNLFQNEFDRGRKFNGAVEKVFNNE